MPQKSPFWSQIFPVVLIVALTLFIYLQTATFRLQYSWDDNRYIFENPFFQGFPSTLGAMFTQPYFGAFLPITMLAYTLQYQLFGFEVQGGYFLVNMLLHALNGVLVYRFLTRFTGHRGVGLLAAVLFVVHPVNVESVAWVSQLKTTLSMTFFLLAWLTHIEANERRRGTLYLVLSWVWFACAIFSKQTAVGGVVLFALYDLWTGYSRNLVRIGLRNLPYALIGVIGVYTILTAHTEVGGIKAPWGSTLAENIALQLRVTADYVGSLLLPVNLNNMYIYTQAEVMSNLPLLVLGLLILVGLVAFAIIQPLGRPFCAFAVVWVVITILPTSNIIPIAIQRADRYLYYPSVMIFMAFAMAALLIWERFRAPTQRYVLVGVATGYVAMMCVIALMRTSVWADTQTLWRDHLTDYPNSQTGLLNLSVGYFNDNDLQSAFQNLTRLVQINPNHYRGHRLLGLTYLRAQQYANAITMLERARQLAPDGVIDFGTQLGAAYFEEGLRLFNQGDYVNALARYSQSLDYVPPDRVPVVLNNVGFTLQKAGRLDDAVMAFNAALELRPNYPLALVNLAETLLLQEKYEESRDRYEQALAQGVQLDARGFSNLCLAKAEMRDDLNTTLQHCQTALTAEPNNAAFMARTAHVLLLYNQNEAARQVAARSLREQPTSLGYRTLGDALMRTGDADGAAEAYRQALLLDPNNPRAQAGLAALGVSP
ncbi:MAG: tetratricopeptide repeat protein [Anaerolineae bacterium]